MNYSQAAEIAYFNAAQVYDDLFRTDRICESHYRFGHSERHLQCVWFDARLRPSRLCTAEGEPVAVIEPGRWNLESGPDFRDAVLLVGKEKRRVCGDVEIHIASKDWTRHGHSKDPRYNKVRFHVTYYADTNPTDLPPGVLHISLAEGLRQTSGFHFEDIDLAAYPFNRCGPVTPCSAQFKEMSFDAKRALLEAAGEERLKRKAQYFSAELASKPPEQLFYEQTLYALGFVKNRKPFRALAERVPAAALAELSCEDAYAVLVGTSSLIPAKIPPEWPEQGRLFTRDCWNRWFRHRNQLEDRIMNMHSWHLAHLRPLNYPARRLAAAAVWFSEGGRMLQQIIELAQNKPATFVQEVSALLTSTTHPFWSYRESWKSSAEKQPVALVGKGRADAIIINVITPMLAALKINEVFEHGLLSKLPQEPSNAIIRETAHRLFDLDHPSALYKSELARQGLIQLFQDHCLSGVPACEECSLPTRLKNLHGAFPPEPQ